MKRFFLIALSLLSLITTADLPLQAPPEGGTRLQRFANPPASARILPLIHYPSANLAEQDKRLTQTLRCGHGGMATNINLNGYVDDEASWPPFIRWIREAHAAGMSLWLYDECGYPSGTARDLVLKGHPEWEARGLVIRAADTTAGSTITVEIPKGTLRAATAFPLLHNEFLCLDKRQTITGVPDSGTFSWTAPVGSSSDRWRLLIICEDFLYEKTHASLSLSRKLHYVNLLMREPTKRFFEIVHDEYARRLGEDLTFITSTFTDEPSLMSYWMRPHTCLVLPWSPDLPTEYAKRTHGRSLLDDVPAILYPVSDGSTAHRRFDFWDMVGELVTENYMGQITDWCTAHGILSGGHLLAEENLAGHVPFYGNFFRVLRRMSAPGSDCLNSIPVKVPWQTPLLAGSAAALNGSRYCMDEVSDHHQRVRRQGDTTPEIFVTEAQILGTLYRLMWGGTNTFTSYYRFGKLTDDDISRINLRCGRVNTLLSEGQTAADIALLYPAETLMTVYQPLTQSCQSKYNRPYAQTFIDAGSALFSQGRTFMIVDTPSLADASATSGSLSYRDLHWQLVILPNITTIPLTAARKLHAFWQSGGSVIAIGKIPFNSTTAFPDSEITRIMNDIFGHTDSSYQLTLNTNAANGRGLCLPLQQLHALGTIVDGLLEPAVQITVNAKDAALRVAQRRTADGDIFMLFNDSENTWQGTVRLCQPAVATLWNPDDGTQHSVDANAIPLDMPPYTARLVTTDVPVRSRPRHFAPQQFLPVVKDLILPFEPPRASKGTYVKGTLKSLPDGFYRAEGTVTKDNVDTFHFVHFPYKDSPFPANSIGISFTVRTQHEQPYAGDLLVFVICKDGSRFLGNAQRSLSEQGIARVFIPFKSCKPHGKTTATILHPEDIIAIQPGWGGYYGLNGQTIIYDIASPQAIVRP